VTDRWRILWLLALAELLIMTLWFSATAVVPQLAVEFGLDDGQKSWLTMSVQIGFVAGALGSGVLNLADRFRAEHVIAASALLGAGFNAAIAVIEPEFASVLALRFLTGVTLAGTYPPGMKVMASWFERNRGLAIGILVGALAVGSAGPHLLNAVPMFGGESGIPPWRPVILTASVLAALGGLIAAVLIRSGPALPAKSRFDWHAAGRIFTDRGVRLANFGYLGHMWELYAMWTWAPLLILLSYQAAGLDDAAARFAGFAVIAVGGAGSVIAGRLADRFGRTTVASASLVISGACCLVAGFLFDTPVLLTVVCLVWGFAVVADSAQFSTAVSELAESSHVGTVLTMQTCTGFLLTMGSIRLVPWLVEHAGWGWAFVVLAPGPVFGLLSMARLRRLPEATRMASGAR